MDNTPITTIFFDLHSTLIDPIALHPCYSAGMGKILSERYGQTPEAWAEANRKVVLDWDSYYADLNLSGEDGITHMWEGLFRTTRAQFRLTRTPEPPKDELIALSRELPGLAPLNCDATYPDVKPAIQALHQAGYMLGVATHAIQAHARAVLTGGGVLDAFTGPILGPDLAERYDKDAMFYQIAALKAQAEPHHIMVVDDDSTALQQAQSIGMKTAHIHRYERLIPSQQADYRIQTLTDLLKILHIKQED